MKPVDQTVFGEHGNCFIACVASILELAPESIPEQVWNIPTNSFWLSNIEPWLEDFGLIMLFIEGITCMDSIPTEVWAIATGNGPRNKRHSVVWKNGATVHDPHPSRDGIEMVEELTFLIQKDPAVPMATHLTLEAHINAQHNIHVKGRSVCPLCMVEDKVRSMEESLSMLLSPSSPLGETARDVVKGFFIDTITRLGLNK